jgi:hypothetical protein
MHNFTSTDRYKASLMLALLFGVVCSPLALARRDRVYQCTDQNGNKVYQDYPCAPGTAAGKKDATERLRWTAVMRHTSSCSVRSPILALSFVSGDADASGEVQRTVFDGGAALVLSANESGVAASIVVDAVWPQRSTSQSSQFDQEANQRSGLDASEQRNQALDNPRPSPHPQAQNQALLLPQARRLELSANIGVQGIWAANTGLMVVDSMSDATRLRFGFGQTRNVLKALNGASVMQIHVRSRSPEIAITSGALEVPALQAAVHAVMSCMQNARAR